VHPFTTRPTAVCARARAAGSPAGLTLLEVVVALAVMALVASLVAPSLVAPEPRGSVLDRALDASRTAALRRAETLRLEIAVGGAWRLAPLPPGDSLTILEGTLSPAPSGPAAIRITAIGTCLAESTLPRELAGFDAARCRGSAP
jgi:prepilin-type N-terminal cleavage/methylation domain-containing protein